MFRVLVSKNIVIVLMISSSSSSSSISVSQRQSAAASLSSSSKATSSSSSSSSSFIQNTTHPSERGPHDLGERGVNLDHLLDPARTLQAFGSTHHGMSVPDTFSQALRSVSNLNKKPRVRWVQDFTLQSLHAHVALDPALSDQLQDLGAAILPCQCHVSRTLFPTCVGNMCREHVSGTCVGLFFFDPRCVCRPEAHAMMHLIVDMEAWWVCAGLAEMADASSTRLAVRAVMMMHRVRC
eukprot:2719083-Rhodomonas_salina.2